MHSMYNVMAENFSHARKFSGDLLYFPGHLLSDFPFYKSGFSAILFCMTPLEKYYNKFHEDHRLTTRHGTVEYNTSMHFIHQYIPEGQKLKILDVGAGTGRYSVALCHEGHDVTAVELVKHNLDILLAKHEKVKCWPGDARNLHFLDDGIFDVTIMFGPMYHLVSDEDKIKALQEARRVTKKGGIIFVAYIMNDYSVIQYCFKQGKIKECMEKGLLTDDFHEIASGDDLYSYVRLEDVERINAACGISREKIFAPDGAADYMRKELNALDEESFSLFLKYQIAVAERPDLLGASSHIVDVLRN